MAEHLEIPINLVGLTIDREKIDLEKTKAFSDKIMEYYHASNLNEDEITLSLCILCYSAVEAKQEFSANDVNNKSKEN